MAQAQHQSIPMISAKSAKRLMRQGARTWVIYVKFNDVAEGAGPACAAAATEVVVPTGAPPQPSAPSYKPSADELSMGTQPHVHLHELDNLIAWYSDVAPPDARTTIAGL